MGRNNKARRAAKRHKRAGQGSAGRRPGAHPFGTDESGTARRVVWDVLIALDGDRTGAEHYANLLTAPGAPTTATAAIAAARQVAGELMAAAFRHGWGPKDLGEITRRRLTARHAPTVAALVHVTTAQHPGHLVDAEWRREMAELGTTDPVDPAPVAELEALLAVASLLAVLPAIPALITAPGTTGARPRHRGVHDDRQLARVRALLAKAESTTFPDEAEALSAKAQELITRYALDRVLTEAGTEREGPDVVSRRFWIEAPYVLAKGLLIDVVAQANGCRAVISEQLGFSTIVGHPADLDSVELLVTSLMVQADVALIRAGKGQGPHRDSRSSSFRRSFLLAYAGRIGERLRGAADGAAQATGRSGELVPLLRRRDEQVAATVTELFPGLTEHAPRIGNMRGWSAGRAAADRAVLQDPAALSADAG